MAQSQERMMFDVAMDWNRLLHDVEGEEGGTIFATPDNFTNEVKLLTFLVEAYQARTPIHLAKLSWNEDIDGAGDLIAWNERVIAAMNYAVQWSRDNLDISEDEDQSA